MNRAANKKKKSSVSPLAHIHISYLVQSTVGCTDYSDFVLVYLVMIYSGFMAKEKLLLQHQKIHHIAKLYDNMQITSLCTHLHTQSKIYLLDHVPGSVAMETPC